ncbi:hypothetical protein T440DRAFT_504400 [Plenodomus tracheiphilus IPT5]|uniref:Uncharacterized protein n=1 Tax=Plenodomus tracheiphilus IPT5 TaxID=1408161 RepID=A0A6A7BKM8_9PLEO|nr:hypothetical protein T440DRAFT_504400 [Plenodomus tracheiphilus IPT5]
MAHDADFVDDRLRLSTFLRVVGHGMPHRPLRFQRSDAITDEQCHGIPNQIDADCVAIPPISRLATPTSQAIAKPPVTTTTSVAQDEPRQIEQEPYMASLHDPSPSSASAQQHINVEQYNRPMAPGTHNYAQRYAFSSPSIKQCTIKPRHSHSKKSRLKLASSSRTRRECPLIHPLPLARMPIYDGLSEPVYEREPNVPATKLNGSSSHSHLATVAMRGDAAKNSATDISVRPFRSPRRGQDVHSGDKKGVHPLTQACKSKLSPLAVQISAPQNIKTASDGFVGSELSIASMQNSARRKGPTVKKRKDTTMRQLTLRRESITKAIASTFQSALSHHQTQSRLLVVRSSVFPGLKVSRHRPRSLQFTTSEEQIATSNRPQSRPPQLQLELVITNKLASVSVPIRRSESSESWGIAGDFSFVEEGGCDRENISTFGGSNFAHLTRIHSPVA